MYTLTQEEFKNHDMNELISAVKGGLDVYKKMENIDDGLHQRTFYEAAIRFGTAELVKACIDAGANLNCVDLEEAMRYGSPLSTFTLGIALNAVNLGTFQALLELGANPRYLYVGRQGWHLRKNIIPEIHHPDTLPLAEQKRLVTFKESIDKGTEIVRLLRSAGIHIPGTKPEDDTISLFEFWRNNEGWSSWEDEKAPRWYDLKPEDFEDFDEKAEYYSEAYGTDGWGCVLPAPGSCPDALWHAASPEALKQMLDAGVDVNMRDKNGYTAIHHLAFYGGQDYYFMPEVMMQMLIDAGADVNERNDYGACPLLLAAEEIRPHPRSIELVKVLLRNGADYHAQTRAGTGIVYWSSKYWYTIGGFENSMLREGTLELVRSVAKDSETIEELGTTNLSDTDIDLMTAAFWGTVDDLKPILEREANINVRTSRGYTPLMFASVYNYAEAVKFLADRALEVPAELDAQNEREETPLTLASMTGDHPVISELIRAGADPQVSGVSFDRLLSGLGNISDLMECFIERGTDLNMRDNDGGTLFLAAMGRCDTQTVREMLAAGANIGLRDDEGRTALMHEVMRSCPSSETFDVLVKAGVDINAQDNEGWTALFYAACNAREPEFIRTLLDMGADVSIRDQDGETALDALLRRESYEKSEVAAILPILLKAGAVIGARPHSKPAMEEATNEAEDTQLSSALKTCELIPCNTFKEAFALNGDEAIASVVRQGFPLTLYDEEYTDVFKAALRADMTETVRACLDMGMDIDENWSGEKWIQTKSFPASCPLYHAIANYSVSAVKLLLERGASPYAAQHLKWRLRVNSCPEFENTDDKALLANNERYKAGAEILRLLHAKDPTIQCKWEGRELTYLYAGGDHEKADTVLSGDALDETGIRKEEPKDMTSLRLALSLEALRSVIASGVTLNERDALGMTVLHHLIQGAIYDIRGTGLFIRELVKAGADINVEDEEKRTPLKMALEQVDTRPAMLEIISLLLELGANPDEITIQEEEPQIIDEALDALKQAYAPETKSRMKVEDAELLVAVVCAAGSERYASLLAQGANVNASSKKGATPLMFAVKDDWNDERRKKLDEAVDFLIQHGANLNVRNDEGDCPLTIALKHGRFVALSALISAGADTAPLLEQKESHEEDKQ